MFMVPSLPLSPYKRMIRQVAFICHSSLPPPPPHTHGHRRKLVASHKCEWVLREHLGIRQTRLKFCLRHQVATGKSFPFTKPGFAYLQAGILTAVSQGRCEGEAREHGRLLAGRRSPQGPSPSPCPPTGPTALCCCFSAEPSPASGSSPRDFPPEGQRSLSGLPSAFPSN